MPRFLASLALPFALWSAVPAVAWCPSECDRIDPECLARCEIVSSPETCGSFDSQCDGMSPAESERDACGVESATSMCPLAACPNRDDPGASSPCPHGRAYCLDDPNGGAGVRPIAPRVLPGWTMVAVLTASLDLDAPARGPHAAPEADARPPTRAWRILPPTRAPPRGSWT
jgi:hypothetical protein